jgi:trk system potassium uptake protein TrkH
MKLVRTRPGGQRNPWTRAPVLVAFGFVAAILAGTLLMSQPWAVAAGHPRLGPLDALFTATSATCVTGLTVASTAHELSRDGQIVVLTLIQIGGFGIMTLAFLVFLSVRSDPSMTGGEVLASTLASGLYAQRPRRALGVVVGGTFLIELVGALLLLPGLRAAGESEPEWKAVFLSVSAFCNAGFDNLDRGVGAHCGDWSLGLPLLGLWLTGGAGFFVILALLARLRHGAHRPLDLTARMVVYASAALVPLGALLFAATEGLLGGLLRGRPWHEQVLLCLFQGNTPRTAGFSMVDLGQAHRVTLLTQILLMLVGGGPGGTAGGVKLTTAWVFAASIWARVRNQEQVVIHKRSLPIGAIRNAVIICTAMVLLHGLCSTLLAAFEGPGRPLEALCFEAASALGTVGLSTGITPDLEPNSRLVLILAMFVGRLGPLTFVYLFVRLRPRPIRVHFPHSEVHVG